MKRTKRQDLENGKEEETMKKQLKNKNGITLIALVITIIVLLLLAGVAISALSGDNGILNRATQAKEQTALKEVQEKIKLAVTAALIDSLGGDIQQDIFQEELDTNFGAGNASLEYDESTKTYIVSVDDYEVEVSSTGSVGEVTKSDISIKLTLSSSNTTLVASELPNVKEVTSENVPIPEGFYYVDGTKDTGVVISDVSGDDLDNSAKGNQFVWVPVNQNQKLMLDVTAKENIAGIKLIDSDGTETTLTASGKTTSQEITMTKNGVYTIEVTTANSSKKAQKRITSLYAQDIEMNVINNLHRLKNYPYESYNSINELLTAKSITLEELLSEEGCSSIGEYMYNNYIYIADQEEEYKKCDRTYYKNYYTDNNQNQESVNKYGGFYIARFEAGDKETTEAGDGTASKSRSDSTSDTNTLVSKKGAYVYNYVDWETSRTLATEMYNSADSTITSVTSQLITGAGWDRTLNWIIETGKSENDVIIDSSSWGNYANSTQDTAISGESNMNYTTGRSEYWKANNIYDLAGNIGECTQEQYDESSILTEGLSLLAERPEKGNVSRGGFFLCYGDDFPASYREGNDPTSQGRYVSFRVQLYINPGT